MSDGAKVIETSRGLLNRLAGRALALLPADSVDWDQGVAALWSRSVAGGYLRSFEVTSDIRLDDLKCIDRQKSVLVRNTQQFVMGAPANNALLTGARGSGKSSLVHALLNAFHGDGLRLVQVEKSALAHLAELTAKLRGLPYRFLVLCDDLSFDLGDDSYRELKSALEGSVFTAAENMLIYATSNRRHLMPERMSDNLAATHTASGEVHPGEAVEEALSLSDRFGVWLSFYPFPQDDYLTITQHWLQSLSSAHGLDVSWDEEVRAEALRWALARGSRNGRTAHAFARDHIGGLLVDQGNYAGRACPAPTQLDSSD